MRTQMRYMRRTILRRRKTDTEKDAEAVTDANGEVTAPEEEEVEQPSMSFPMCVGLLIVVTVVRSSSY